MRCTRRVTQAVLAMMLLVGATSCGGGVDEETVGNRPANTTTATATSTTIGERLPGYGPSVESNFMDSCASGGGDFEVCECAFDEISHTIDFVRFVEVDEFMQTNPDSDLPDEFVVIYEQCLDRSKSDPA